MTGTEKFENGVQAMETTGETLQYRQGDDTADFGDFPSNKEEQYDLEEQVEVIDKYSTEATSSVLYPICVGEVLNERYLVEHKIGHGGFSTVWMAHDLQDKRDVALKVLSSGEGGEYGENELRMQDKVIQTVQDTSRIVKYLDTFVLHESMGGHHRAIVFPLMGPCFDPIFIRERKIPMATRMSAAQQLLKTLKSLHEAGIVHRDLNPKNCMWGMVPLNDYDRSAKYKAFGRPKKTPIPLDDLPKDGELVSHIEIPEDLRTEEFYLGDFGLAMKVGDPVTHHGFPPTDYCSPDRFHQKSPSFACDMWSYMVIFSELYFDLPPFNPGKGGIISGIVAALGPLPEQWRGLCTYPRGALDSWYDQSRTPVPKCTLAASVARFRPDADPVEKEHVHSIMPKIFHYCPEKRLSAAQLLQDPSFRAIMDNYGC